MRRSEGVNLSIRKNDKKYNGNRGGGGGGGGVKTAKQHMGMKRNSFLSFIRERKCEKRKMNATKQVGIVEKW